MTNRRAVKVVVKEAFTSFQKTWKETAVMTPDDQLPVDRVDHSQDNRQMPLANTHDSVMMLAPAQSLGSSASPYS